MYVLREADLEKALAMLTWYTKWCYLQNLQETIDLTKLPDGGCSIVKQIEHLKAHLDKIKGEEKHTGKPGKHGGNDGREQESGRNAFFVSLIFQVVKSCKGEKLYQWDGKAENLRYTKA